MEINNPNINLISRNQVQLNIDIFKDILGDVLELKRIIISLKNNKIIQELHLSEEELKSLGLFDEFQPLEINKKKRRHLSKSEIEDAQKHCDNAFECARYLKVGYSSYKNWSNHYGIFKKNPWRGGSKKTKWVEDKGKHPLNQILKGKFPEYSSFRLKDLLIRSGIKKPRCENCGFEERRITDQRIPLLINFKDNNEKNHLLDNIQILCYNCMFLIGKGYIHRGNVEFTFLDT